MKSKTRSCLHKATWTIALLLVAACSGTDSPAGMHLCSVVNQSEVDQIIGTNAGPGEHSAPFVNVEVCVWHAGGSTLTLRRFPSPEGGIADALGGADVILQADGTAFAANDSEMSVAVEDGRATLVLELSPAQSERRIALTNLANRAAERSP